jgi:hypothetical protein
MTDYLHRLVGLYATRESAEEARVALLACGVAPQHMRLLGPGAGAVGPDADADSDDVLQDLLRDGAIGTAAGTVAAAGATIALAAANITLFIASPVLGTLAMLGWGASLGGLIGAAVGADRAKGDVPALITDARANGQYVLLVRASSEDETVQAQRVLGNSMAAAA